jgi:hypothetical protein
MSVSASFIVQGRTGGGVSSTSVTVATGGVKGL